MAKLIALFALWLALNAGKDGKSKLYDYAQLAKS